MNPRAEESSADAPQGPLEDVAIPATYEEFDFAWPLGAYGRSSGWLAATSVEATIANPLVAPRRPVNLVSVGRAVEVQIADGRINSAEVREDAPVYIKRSGGDGVAGLSSGASSALVRRGGDVIKLKRCGYLAQGVEGTSVRIPVQVMEAGALVEAMDAAPVGLMTLAMALHECITLDALHCIGLCPAYRARSVLIVTAIDGLPPGFPPLGISQVACRSDLRADEVAYMAMTPIIAECVRAGSLHLNGATGLFEALSSLRFGSIRVRHADCYERLHLLGVGLGGALRRLHEEGFSRGRGSAWFGNEVVDGEGHISIVDADGGVGPMHDCPADLRADLARIEVADYRAGFVGYLSWGQALPLAHGAAILDEAFISGYQGRAEPAISADALISIISAHVAELGDLGRLLGFGSTRGRPAHR